MGETFTRHFDDIGVSTGHNKECYPPSNDTLGFVPEVGKLGGTWLWGANQLVSWVFYTEKKANRQHFILHVTILATWNNQYGIKLGFHWQMTHVEFANDVIHSHNIQG